MTLATGERTLRVAVVGTGFGCFTHVRALRAAGFDVCALVGRDAEKTRERARLFEVAHPLTDFDEALAMSGLDAVTIATPPHTHAELTARAVAAGKHVICEKPFARDAREAAEVLAAAEKAGVVHLLGTEFRYDTGQALLARTVAAGAIGEPRLVTLILYVPMLVDESAEVPPWWADAEQGGGWLGAHGAQLIDQVRVTCGEFAAVSAALPQVADRSMSSEDGFVVQFRLASGAHGTLASSAGDRGAPLIATQISGTRGSAWIDGLGNVVRLADATGTRLVPVPDDLRTPPASPPPREALRTAYERMTGHGLDVGPYTRLAEAFRDRILGRPPAPGPSPAIQPATFSDGVADMAVLDAIRASAARDGEWVDVDVRTVAPVVS